MQTTYKFERVVLISSTTCSHAFQSSRTHTIHISISWSI